MNEEQWLACDLPEPMLRHVIGKDYSPVSELKAFPNCIASDCKLRLLACACYHRIRHLLPDPLARTAVEAAEAFADGLVPVEQLRDANVIVYGAMNDLE